MDYKVEIGTEREKLNEEILRLLKDFENRFGLLFDGIETERAAVEGLPGTTSTTRVDTVFVTK